MCVFRRGISRNNTCEWNYPTTGSVLCFDVAITWLSMPIFFFMVKQPLVSQGLLIIEALRSHSDTPHSLGLLWAREKPDAETACYNHNRQISMIPAEFEPAIPASERPKIQGLERAASGIRYIILPSSLELIMTTSIKIIKQSITEQKVSPKTPSCYKVHI